MLVAAKTVAGACLWSTDKFEGFSVVCVCVFCSVCMCVCVCVCVFVCVCGHCKTASRYIFALHLTFSRFFLIRSCLPTSPRLTIVFHRLNPK